MKVDSKDRLWLFIGNTNSYYQSFKELLGPIRILI